MMRRRMIIGGIEEKKLKRKMKRKAEIQREGEQGSGKKEKTIF